MQEHERRVFLIWPSFVLGAVLGFCSALANCCKVGALSLEMCSWVLGPGVCQPGVGRPAPSLRRPGENSSSALQLPLAPEPSAFLGCGSNILISPSSSQVCLCLCLCFPVCLLFCPLMQTLTTGSEAYSTSRIIFPAGSQRCLPRPCFQTVSGDRAGVWPGHVFLGSAVQPPPHIRAKEQNKTKCFITPQFRKYGIYRQCLRNPALFSWEITF